MFLYISLNHASSSLTMRHTDWRCETDWEVNNVREASHCGKPVLIISPSGIAYRFVSQSEAARFIGAASSDVNAAVRGKQQKVRGYSIFENPELLEGKQ